MKSIHTLKPDIDTILDSGLDHDPSPEKAAEYAMRIGGEMAKATRPRSKERESGKLWASDLGESCYRKTYYKFWHPDKAEPLMGHTKFKFLYGNILEEAVLYLAEEAGHKVEGQQVRIEIPALGKDGTVWSISGRTDAVIDSALLDVKTTSSYGYNKYKKEGGINPDNDSFGYLFQLGFYHHYGQAAGLDYDPNESGFLWIDKQNGHIMYDNCVEHLPTQQDIEMRVSRIMETVGEDVEPMIPFSSVPDGKSGNMKLPIKCSYCDFKKHCHRDANGGKGLRSFAYSHGPVHLTTVAREPKCPEITDA